MVSFPDLDDGIGGGRWYWSCDRDGDGTQTRLAIAILDVYQLGTDLAQGGPLGLLLGFSFVGRSPIVPYSTVPDLMGACIGLVW
jgi:hypothetical protein